MSMRIVQKSPCYCSFCDAPDALLIKGKHEIPVYDHIEIRLALCLKHAEQLASILLQHVHKARRSLSSGETHD